MIKDFLWTIGKKQVLPHLYLSLLTGYWEDRIVAITNLKGEFGLRMEPKMKETGLRYGKGLIKLQGIIWGTGFICNWRYICYEFLVIFVFFSHLQYGILSLERERILSTKHNVAIKSLDSDVRLNRLKSYPIICLSHSLVQVSWYLCASVSSSMKNGNGTYLRGLLWWLKRMI